MRAQRHWMDGPTARAMRVLRIASPHSCDSVWDSWGRHWSPETVHRQARAAMERMDAMSKPRRLAIKAGVLVNFKNFDAAIARELGVKPELVTLAKAKKNRDDMLAAKRRAA